MCGVWIGFCRQVWNTAVGHERMSCFMCWSGAHTLKYVSNVTYEARKCLFEVSCHFWNRFWIQILCPVLEFSAGSVCKLKFSKMFPKIAWMYVLKLHSHVYKRGLLEMESFENLLNIILNWLNRNFSADCAHRKGSSGNVSDGKKFHINALNADLFSRIVTTFSKATFSCISSHFLFHKNLHD